MAEKNLLKLLFGITLVIGLVLMGCDPGNGTGDKIYTVTIGTLTNANGSSITADPTSGVEGTEITLTINPSSNYQLKTGTLKYGTTEIDETTKKFNLPASNVTITAEFELSGPTDNVVQKTVEAVYNLIVGDTIDISQFYGKPFQEAWIEDASDIADIYLDSQETQPISKTTIITAGLVLYAKQSIWNELPPGGNNVIAEIYRGTYNVDSSSSESITELTLGEYTLSGTGGGSSISSPNYRTKGGGDLISEGTKVGTWAYIYSVRTKQGFVYQINSSQETKIYFGANATSASDVLSSYGVTIDLSDMASNPWGIYAVKN